MGQDQDHTARTQRTPVQLCLTKSPREQGRCLSHLRPQAWHSLSPAHPVWGRAQGELGEGWLAEAG